MRLLSLILFGLMSSFAKADGPSFLNDVEPILTKAGCSQGACHGKGSGQNGFRLSLRGYAPNDDFRWITREFESRRVFPADPDNSLLLLKASGKVPHEGGRLFSDTDPEYATLRKWIAAGCPGPNAADAKLVKLTVTPGKVLTVGEKATMKAMAEFSDGSTRDVTRTTRWDSNDAAVLTVAKFGSVTAHRPGATAVRAAFLTEVAVASFVVPNSKPADEQKFKTGRSVIDTHVQARLKELQIEPSALCDDLTFQRRVMLDLLGVLPTPDEVRAFQNDKSADKRVKLIDALLQRPEYADYWTLFLSDLLQNRKERDHDVRGVIGVRQFHAWLRQQVAANRGWDAISRDVLLASGNSRDNPAVGYYLVTLGEHREAEKSEVAESVAQAFLGTRIGCARCHNHPLERYTQDDFYHFSAYFTRVKLERHDPKQKDSVLVAFEKDAKENDKPVQVRQPRTNQMLKPQPLDRVSLQLGQDPRIALVDWIVSPKNEAFRGAMVNRLWKHFFREGLVEPVDDLRATNPPSNPALFTALGDEFAGHKFDFKYVIRLILNSEAYQRSSATLPINATETRFYSHYYARRIPSEVLLDAIASATGVPEKFEGYPLGLRAVQVPDPASASPFLQMFGSSMRVTACACERTGDVTLPQALSLVNGESLKARLRNSDGVLAKVLAKERNNDTIIDDLFLRTFSRLPRLEERQAIHSELKLSEKRDEVFYDLFWALLNSKEFAFNH